jgi:hypothetical protein
MAEADKARPQETVAREWMGFMDLERVSGLFRWQRLKMGGGVRRVNHRNAEFDQLLAVDA